MSLLVEGWLPRAVSVVVLAIWWWLFDATFPASSANLLAASGTVASVLIGFLATAKAIILSISGSNIFKVLKKSGYNKVVFNYIYEATIAGLALLVVSIIGFFVDETNHNSIKIMIFHAFWVLTATYSISTFWRVMHIIFKMLKQA